MKTDLSSAFKETHDCLLTNFYSGYEYSRIQTNQTFLPFHFLHLVVFLMKWSGPVSNSFIPTDKIAVRLLDNRQFGFKLNFLYYSAVTLNTANTEAPQREAFNMFHCMWLGTGTRAMLLLILHYLVSFVRANKDPSCQSYE